MATTRPRRSLAIRRMDQLRIIVLVSWWIVFPAHSFAEDAVPDRLGILLDTSGEMGFVVPRARKEVRYLNSELQKAGRAPVVLLEMKGASIDQIRGFGLPARRNALVQLKTLFEKEKVDGVYWITHFKGDQSGAGFTLLDQLLSGDTSEGKSSRQLLLRHYWPEQILAGRAWRLDKGSASLDPLHPEAFPEEWLEPIRKSRGYVLRSWRSLPEKYIQLTAYPENAIWPSELKNRYGLYFFRKGDYRHYEPTGFHLVSRATVVPYSSEKSRKARDQLVYEELCRRPSLEADLSLIERKILTSLNRGRIKLPIRGFPIFKMSNHLPPRSGTIATSILTTPIGFMILFFMRLLRRCAVGGNYTMNCFPVASFR